MDAGGSPLGVLLVGKWTFSWSAGFWVHQRGATQGQGGEEWARGLCDNVQGGCDLCR